MNRIRSSRRLETESRRNLELLWLLGDRSPEHKAIAEFRRRNGGLLKSVYTGFVKPRERLSLYGKELAAIGGAIAKGSCGSGSGGLKRK
jgi:transposase